MENMTRSAWDFEDSLGGDVEQGQDPPPLNCSHPPCFRLLTLSWPRMNSDVMSSNQVVGRWFCGYPIKAYQVLMAQFCLRSSSALQNKLARE
ncbi:hypothetical protein Peur_065906 [Populus x canadensis]